MSNFGFSGPNPFGVSYSQRPYARISMLDLILIRTDSTARTMNYTIKPVEKIEETFYKAWLQVMHRDRLYHIIYMESKKAKMVLTSFYFDDAGNLVRKPLYSNREITIEGGYPSVTINNSLIAFYFNKATDESGLIKIGF